MQLPSQTIRAGVPNEFCDLTLAMHELPQNALCVQITKFGVIELGLLPVLVGLEVRLHEAVLVRPHVIAASQPSRSPR